MSTVPGVDRTPPLNPILRREYPQSRRDDRGTGKRHPPADEAPGTGGATPPTVPPTSIAPDGARGRIVNTFADSRPY